jgi:hypothetical protein
MNCTTITQYIAPIVLGSLWIISEILSYIPNQYIKSNGVLQLLTNSFMSVLQNVIIPMVSSSVGSPVVSMENPVALENNSDPTF